jgi:hypothetical protein
MTTQDQIDAFHKFATAQIQSSGAQFSVPQLADLWDAQSLTASELSESSAAVAAALSDMENGDAGRPIADLIDDLRKQSGQSTNS